jgi:hypothetical protein
LRVSRCVMLLQTIQSCEQYEGRRKEGEVMITRTTTTTMVMTDTRKH